MDDQATRKFLKNHHILMIIFLVAALVAIAVGVYYYNQYASLNNLLKNPNIAVEKQTKELVSQVGKLMVLPTDEQPTLATVTDASKLKDQPFFKNAKNGDKVLIYVKAKKAILYDPAKNVIVDVAPVNLSQSNQQAQPAVSASPTVVPTSSYVVPTAPVTPAPTK